MRQPVDSSILHEIVRVIDSRGRVPDKVQIRGKRYQITYLDDHKQRMEEALRRHDPDRLNMLYGQMASKVKYQAMKNAARQGSGSLKDHKRAARKKPARAQPKQRGARK